MKRNPLIYLLAIALGGSISASGQTFPAQIPEKPDVISIPALLREVRESQDWITKIQSFRVKFEIEIPRAIQAAAPAPQIAGPAATQPDSRRTPRTLEIAFDDKRLYTNTTSEYGSDVTFWDGKMAFHQVRENQVQLTDSPDALKSSFRFSGYWGQAGHAYWWMSGQQGPGNLILAPSVYRLAANEKFHGVDCYVLQNDRRPGTCYIGVADHRLYGFTDHSQTEWYGDYKEVAPDCWFPMTIGTESSPPAEQAGGGVERKISQGPTQHVTEIAIDEPLPNALFDKTIKDGTRVHEEIAGVARDYVYKANRSPEELAEMKADAARHEHFAPPLFAKGESISLGDPLDPLPLNPLAVNPAPDFPAAAKWLNGKPVKLADLHGKVVLVVFWATWQDFSGDSWPRQTPPPDYTLPDALKADAVIIGVHAPTDDAPRVEQSIKQHNFQFPVCLDVAMPKFGWGAMADQYRVDELPAVYVIDQNGKVAAWGKWADALRRAGELLGKPATQP